MYSNLWHTIKGLITTSELMWGKNRQQKIDSINILNSSGEGNTEWKGTRRMVLIKQLEWETLWFKILVY